MVDKSIPVSQMFSLVSRVNSGSLPTLREFSSPFEVLANFPMLLFRFLGRLVVKFGLGRAFYEFWL